MFVKHIENLLAVDLANLLEESKNEGYLFLDRLVNDYKNGQNCFNKQGEALYGVFTFDGTIIAIGGINMDPYSNVQKMGRLRRFYVSKEYRRQGIGRLLLNSIIKDAKSHFDSLVLYTDTAEASQFYTSYGFKRENSSPYFNHYLSLLG